ncbi:MAG TPA: hypothetical protein VD836_17900 [Solirubrobacteraceae bacterium]|nr:hypothetical protein [Solirubrobacteraceae bacterium]
MTTLCRAYTTEDDAHAAVNHLLAHGLPGADIRVLMGHPEHDHREEPVGRFAGESVAPADPVGSFAGAAGSSQDAMGEFAASSTHRRQGGFGDFDRDTTTSYPNGVARVDVTTHRDLRKSLVEAGLDEPTADADIKALHQGRVLVLVQTGALSHDDLVTALDGRLS